MITLPNQNQLAEDVRLAIDSAGCDFDAIICALDMKMQPNTCLARGRPETHRTGGEFLFDFCALIPEGEDVADCDRFPAQAAVVGEIEIANTRDGEVDWDFEKLLIADALVLFIVFKKRNVNEANSKLEWLVHAAKRRQATIRLRGNQPPTFVLSCWVRDHFEHRIVREDTI